MTDPHDQLSEFTLHVVLATFPQNQETDFDNSVRKEFYHKYRDKCSKYLKDSDEKYWCYNDDLKTPVLYNPLSYIILGNYDVAYISLIDNFKFAQRLFEPQSNNNQDDAVHLFGPHTFQSFTGITHHDAISLKKFFYDHLNLEKPSRKFFLGICNLKLNNGFLIGNGKRYLEAVIDAINKIISKFSGVEHLVLQSFSWFEISLMIFTDDPQQVADIIQTLRRLTMECLLKSDTGILEKSLYQSFYPEENTSFFEHANVFADTHTYVGIHQDVFTGNPDYGKQLDALELCLQTEVEWQIKPGHLHNLTQLLVDHEVLKTHPTGKDDKSFLAGRSDYTLKTELTKLNDVVRLIRLIINKETKLYEHVRKIKTNLYFKGLDEIPHEPKTVINLHEKLTPLAEDMESVAKVNEQLKALKLSRQIRSKVIKIFSNYNNGVQDLVLFPYLLDFKIFVTRLKDAIQEAYNQCMDRFDQPLKYVGGDKVDRLEDVLMKMIDIFQEGFNIRMLNPYQFEDINDFDLDFNSSIQQLLSVYSTIAFEIGNLIYRPDYTYGPVIQLNLKDTVSNDSSINYYVHHLTSPEFVFATLTKEILNAVPKDDDTLERLIKEYQAIKADLLEKSPTIRDLDQRGLINLSYFFNDAFRFVWTYKMDFKLFYYWFWTYNFQNPSLYSEMGLMDESHFEKELFRIIFVAKFFEPDLTLGADPLTLIFCPLPELETYWERHFERISQAVSEFVRFLKKRGIELTFLSYLERRFNLIMERGEQEFKLAKKSRAADNEASKLISRIESQHWVEIGMPRLYSYRFARRCYLFGHLGQALAELKSDTILYLEWYIWNYLNTIYKINDGKISLVRRNWKTGEPMVSFVYDNDAAHLYSVDQTGGLFFENMEQQNNYFKLTTRALLDLWDFSLTRKKLFIISQTSTSSHP